MNDMSKMNSLSSLFLFTLTILLLSSCDDGKNKPDVSKIKVKLETVRFEKDFFQMDTADLDKSMQKLWGVHHIFMRDYIYKILALENTDTSKWGSVIKRFYADYKPIFDSTLLLDKEIDQAKQKLETSLRYVKYYFPHYKLPEQFITFIAPMDAFAYSETGGSGEILTTLGIGAGLQLHLGEESMVYKSEAGMQLYPEYISRKFDVAHIPVNAMRVIIDDIHEPLKQGGSLLDIMIDHGKRMYLLDLFMPDEKEELKYGYTSVQLEAMKENEGFVWNYFTENNLLYETDMLKIRSFVTDGPSTAEFGIGSPGYISLYTGKQIIDAFMENNPDTQLQVLLKMDAKKILSGSTYKPR
jgi:hypothetical protein